MANNNAKKNKGGWSTLILLILIVIFAGIFFFLQFGNFSNPEAEAQGPAKATNTAAPLSATDAAGTSAPEDTASLPTETETAEEDAPSAPPQYPVSDQRVTYQDGFYYEPVDGNTALMDRIRTLSYNEAINTKMSFDKLSYVRVKYIDFQDREEEGEIICSRHIAQDLVEIFYDLYLARYQIEHIRLLDDYGADDRASMEANNSSAFNYRLSTGTTDDISEHSWGVCIDINPLYNPYVSTTNGTTVVEPASAAAYADRSQSFPHKIDEEDLCYKLFTQHGFTWGGHWNRVKDYQHFQRQR